jgi:hypothetical protein
MKILNEEDRLREEREFRLELLEKLLEANKDPVLNKLSRGNSTRDENDLVEENF